MNIEYKTNKAALAGADTNVLDDKLTQMIHVSLTFLDEVWVEKLQNRWSQSLNDEGFKSCDALFKKQCDSTVCYR